MPGPVRLAGSGHRLPTPALLAGVRGQGLGGPTGLPGPVLSGVRGRELPLPHRIFGPGCLACRLWGGFRWRLVAARSPGL